MCGPARVATLQHHSSLTRMTPPTPSPTLTHRRRQISTIGWDRKGYAFFQVSFRFPLVFFFSFFFLFFFFPGSFSVFLGVPSFFRLGQAAKGVLVSADV